jgi:hypothetical protein
MATVYEVFLLQEGAFRFVGVEDAHSPKKALDQVVSKVADLEGEPMDTSGEYLVVPSTNATYLRRGKRTEYFTEEYDPTAPETAQEVLA